MLRRRSTCVWLVPVSAFIVFALSSSIAFAQPTLNPTQAQFTPSADHNNTMPDGTPIVSSYRLDLFLQGASAPFQSNPLGKPTPVNGTITVDLTSIFAGWPVPGTIYVADVAAVGPGGSAPSALSNTFQFGTACSFTVSPLNPSATAAGGAASLGVTAGTGCAWTATSSATWITISSGGSGSGNGTVNYTVAANTATTSRTGTLTVAGQTVTVTQAAACSFTVSPLNPSATAAGGAASIGVTAGSTCNWTATSSATWITISSGGSGTGNGTVNYTVAANTATTSRTGTLTVAGQTVTVTQAAACSFTVSPLNPSATAAGGAASIGVTAGSTCNWTATSSATWITISSGGSGTGNGTVNYTVAANTATTSRTGTLTVAGQTVTVTQAGAPCTFGVSPTTATPGGNGGALTVTVTAQAGCNWTATSGASWLTITSGASGSGNGTVNYTVAVNPASTTRTGALTVAGTAVSVTQDPACTFTVSPLTATPPAAGGAATLTVTSGSGCGWTAVSNNTWITVTSGASGTANGTVGYNVAANSTSSSRTGTLTVAGKTVTLTQPTSLTAPTAPSGLQIKP